MIQSRNSKHLCIVAGKSGGHILPGQAIANNFVQFDKDCNVLFFTTLIIGLSLIFTLFSLNC